MEKKWPFSFHSVIIRIMICGDPTKGSRCYGDSRKKYRGRDRIVRLEILLGTASVGSKGRKLGEGRKEKKKEKNGRRSVDEIRPTGEPERSG